MRGATTLIAIVMMCATGVVAPVSHAESSRDVVFVANAEDGTVSILDARSFEMIRTLDVVPDGEAPPPTEDPFHAATYPFVVGAAGVNLAQDLDVSPDGRTLYVSRGHRADVAAFDIASGQRLWRAPVSGLRSDHMTISDDGTRLYVSALTESKVEVIDTATGTVVGSFPTGEWAHDNVLSPDGGRVYNGSIGNVLTPEETRNDRPAPVDAVLGSPYVLTIANAETMTVERTIDFTRGIRPFVITADEAKMYAQLSQYHGLIEVDLATGATPRTLDLPIADGVTEDDYDFEAPHHGLALSPDERYLCVAGRASDYAAIVDVETFQPAAIIPVDDAPGWASNTPDGTHCIVTSTRADTVSVISYDTLEKVATIEAGDGPKYLSPARVPADVL